MPSVEVKPEVTHIYRMSRWQHFVGIAVLTIGLLVLVGIWSEVLTGARDAHFVEMMIPVILAPIGALFSIGAFRNTVAPHPDCN